MGCDVLGMGGYRAGERRGECNRRLLIHWGAETGEICYDGKVLAVEAVRGVMDLAEHAMEVGEPEIVDVFVEDIKPRAVGTDPVEAGDFDVDFSLSAIGIAQQTEEIERIADVFEDVAEDDAIRADARLGSEVLFGDGWGAAFVGGINAGDGITLMLEFFQEQPLAATDFDERVVLEVVADESENRVEMALEGVAVCLLVL